MQGGVEKRAVRIPALTAVDLENSSSLSQFGVPAGGGSAEAMFPEGVVMSRPPGLFLCQDLGMGKAPGQPCFLLEVTVASLLCDSTWL